MSEEESARFPAAFGGKYTDHQLINRPLLLENSQKKLQLAFFYERGLERAYLQGYLIVRNNSGRQVIPYKTAVMQFKNDVTGALITESGNFLKDEYYFKKMLEEAGEMQEKFIQAIYESSKFSSDRTYAEDLVFNKFTVLQEMLDGMGIVVDEASGKYREVLGWLPSTMERGNSFRLVKHLDEKMKKYLRDNVKLVYNNTAYSPSEVFKSFKS